jgi:hypothetical protein
LWSRATANRLRITPQHDLSANALILLALKAEGTDGMRRFRARAKAKL